MREIELTEQQLKILLSILRKRLPLHAKVLLFGSRAMGTAKPYSDIDLAIDAGHALSLTLLANLAEDFVESELPFKVDIVDCHDVNDAFRSVIVRDGKRIL